jgi:hypothetical protein
MLLGDAGNLVNTTAPPSFLFSFGVRNRGQHGTILIRTIGKAVPVQLAVFRCPPQLTL